MSGDARAVVLERIRTALGAHPRPPEVPRGYRAAGTVPPDVERFCERVADYRATVHRTSSARVGEVVRGLCPGRTAVCADAPCPLDGIEVVHDDPPVAIDVLDGVDSVLTGCALAVAETGTIVLDGSPRCGRRALSLVPDHHVCVVHAGQVVAEVTDAVASLPHDRPLTFVSGPSATSDIELERVEGVHGPRRLDVVVVSD